MASFDFQGALASGATPQAITSFLSSQGQGQLAQTYFNMNPTPAAQANNNPGIALSLLKSLAQPFTEAVGTGVRAIQAAPKLAGAVGDAITGNKANMQTNLAAAQQTMAKPILGENTFAGNTPEQNLGQAAKAASFVVPAAMGENAIGPVFTAAEGAGVGGLQNAGEALNQNQSAPQVAGAFVKGAGAGAALGVGGEMAIKGVGGLQDAIANASDTAGKTGTAADTLASRTADATPDYNKKMVGDTVKLPGTVDEQGNNIPGKVVPRVNEGEGLTGKRTVNTSASEAANGKELANIKSYPDNGTALQKSQAVHAEISTEADNLRSSLAAEDKANPLKADVAKNQVSKNVFDNMNGDARNAFLGTDNKILAQAGIPAETAKTIVGRYGQDVADAVSKYDGTRQGLLDLRQNLDNVYQDARGNSAFGSDHRNALDEMHTAVRDYLNNELHTSTASTDVQASLGKQSRLFRAKDVLDAKAEAEATSHYGRILQDHPGLRRVANVLSRQGLMVPLRIVEALAGVSVVTAAARKVASGK